jgi:hypothetical protein
MNDEVFGISDEDWMTVQFICHGVTSSYREGDKAAHRMFLWELKLWARQVGLA